MLHDLFRFNRVFSCRVVEQYLSRCRCVFDINAHLYDFHIAVHMRRYLSSFARIVVLCVIGFVNRIHGEVNKRQRHLSIHSQLLVLFGFVLLMKQLHDIVKNMQF